MTRADWIVCTLALVLLFVLPSCGVFDPPRARIESQGDARAPAGATAYCREHPGDELCLPR